MSLVKHSARTVRKGCKSCGSTALYWAHDTERPGDSGDRGADCTGGTCGVNGKLTLVNATDVVAQADPGETLPDGVRHHESCPGTVGQERPASEPVPAAENDSPAPAPATPITTAPGVPADAAAALAALMATLSPQVDPAVVDAMIAARFDAYVFPHTTVIERANGETVTVDGAHSSLPSVLRKSGAGLHVMMVGPAGTGKSHLAESVAHALTIPFRFISCSPTMTDTKLLGFIDAGGNYRRTAFRECYENGGLFLFDEIDNASAPILTVMNAALANGHCEFPDDIVKRHPDFRCVGAANTYGRGADRQYVGRQQLDAATLDRFAVVDVDYDVALERSLCLATGLDSSEVDRVLDTMWRLRANARDKGMRVIVSLRATVGACKLILAGETFDECLESLVFKGMSQADRAKLTA